LKEHVEISDGQVSFDFPAKSGLRRLVSVRDEQAKEILRHLKARRDGGDRLLAYRNGVGWREVGAEDINAYLRELAGDGFTAKDFRTWHATVLAALALAARVDPDSPLTQRKRAVAAAVKEVAETLGNTPAVCRSSYVDPTVVDAFLEGRTIASRLAEIDRDDLDDPRIQAEVEAAVLELLTEGVEEREPAAA
jgi:DNA topoisomerase IB